VTELPDTVQTNPVSDTKVTGIPEEAVALIENGAACQGFAARALNVIVWFAGVTVMEIVLLVDEVFSQGERNHRPEWNRGKGGGGQSGTGSHGLAQQ
jgi:hypothetical protein